MYDYHFDDVASAHACDYNGIILHEMQPDLHTRPQFGHSGYTFTMTKRFVFCSTPLVYGT